MAEVTNVPLIPGQEVGDFALISHEPAGKDGVVFQHPNRLKIIALRRFQDIQMAQKATVDAFVGKSVCRGGHGRVRYAHFVMRDFNPQPPQFLDQSTIAILALSSDEQ